MIKVMLLSWFVNIFSNGHFIHGGHYESHPRCEIAKANLMSMYRRLGYPNLLGFCVWTNTYRR